MFKIYTCDNCEHHIEFYDEVDGKTYHDGCICDNKNANIQELHILCCNSLEPCPYKKEQSEN